MKKPIEVGQRVVEKEDGRPVRKGEIHEVAQTSPRYKVSFDNGTTAWRVREVLRILKPKPKRVCHCNREPDRWVINSLDGSYFGQRDTKEDASFVAKVYFGEKASIAACWIGPKEEVK